MESTERREGVGEEAPDLPLGPYCDTMVTAYTRARICSYLWQVEWDEMLMAGHNP